MTERWLNQTHLGDCRILLAQMALSGVQINTCVTSPPYFGLRDYGCPGQLGQEQTPDAFVAALVSVFRLVRDVLREDGTLWLNLGDSYAGSWGAQSRGNTTGEASGKLQGSSMLEARRISAGAYQLGKTQVGSLKNTPGLKNKDLIGIPWRVAFALQADGWFLRQDIVWSKPNPMPESITDRCTKAHEYIFLLSKSRRYYFDHEAIKEPVATSSKKRLAQNIEAQQGSSRVPGKTNGNMKAVGGTELRNKRSVWTVTTKPFKGAHFATFPPDLISPCILAGSPVGGLVLDPFMGSGTTGVVAQELQRNFIGCELNPAYIGLREAENWLG